MVEYAKKVCIMLVILIGGCSAHQAEPVAEDDLAQENRVIHEGGIDPQGVGGLVNFLMRNDCSQVHRDEFEVCYERTRLRLIQTTQSLEEAEYRINQLTTRRGKVMP